MIIFAIWMPIVVGWYRGPMVVQAVLWALLKLVVLINISTYLIPALHSCSLKLGTTSLEECIVAEQECIATKAFTILAYLSVQSMTFLSQSPLNFLGLLTVLHILCQRIYFFYLYFHRSLYWARTATSFFKLMPKRKHVT